MPTISLRPPGTDSSSRRSTRIWKQGTALALGAGIACGSGAANDATPGSGLVLSLEPATGLPVASIVSNVVLRVENGEAADPMIPAGTFRACWQGELHVELRTECQFRAEGHGDFELRVNGTRVALAEFGSEEWSPPVRLKKGPNRIDASFRSESPPHTSLAGTGSIRLWWRGRGIPPQPVPAAVFSPGPITNETRLASSAAAAAGRDLFLRYRCGRCHAPEVAPGSAVPELSMDAPAFGTNRLREDWLQRWLSNPVERQPWSTMPRMLHGPTTATDVEAVTAWLTSLGPGDAPPEGPTTSRTPAVGKALFGSLLCNSCHTGPGEPVDPAKFSLEEVAGKYRSGALERYLQNPRARFAWSPMPDFGLSAEEAAHLAAWLEAPSITTPSAPPATEEGHSSPSKSRTGPASPPETAAPTAPDHGPSEARSSVSGERAAGEPRPDPQQLARGRELAETAGCLNCHTGPAQNRFHAPALSALPAEVWNRGCLAEVPPASGHVPWFAFDAARRAQLRAFAATDRASLGRHVPADFAKRWMHHLRCDECHRRAENLPGIALAGAKLLLEWTRRLLEGLVPYKPRPWLQARMPAFPSWAPLLAPGLAAQQGVPPVSPVEPPLDSAAAADGRKLVSASGGFACVTCHRIGKYAATAVFEAPGIDFTRVADRLRPEFFQRWVRQPQTIDPSTKMPLYFDEEGNSALTDFYGGDGQRTIHALWNYVRQGTNAPPPDP